MYRIERFWFRYPEQLNWALQRIDLSFTGGEVVLLTGPNGGGKSSLLRSLLGVIPSLTGGETKGAILFNDKKVSDSRIAELAGVIGIMFQDPDVQITNLSVEEEVAFGPENLCLDRQTIVDRVNQSLAFMELAGLQQRSVLTLSGGQKQRLSLAALLAMKPDVLILDEPAAHLDIWGVISLVEAIKEAKQRCRLVVLATHWLDPFISLATRMVVLDQGMVRIDIPIAQAKDYRTQFETWGIQTPQAFEVGTEPLNIAPVSIGQQRSIVELAEADNVYYQYHRDLPFVLEGVNLCIRKGEHIALIGKNGSGKTTFTRLLAGLRHPSQGRLTLRGKPALALQNPTLGFVTTRVAEEVSFGAKLDKQAILSLLERFGLTNYCNRSPFLLSGGEQRRLSIAVALAQDPKLLILDEPTAGVDLHHTKVILDEAKQFSGAVLHVTHDLRVIAESERLVAFEKGQVVFNDCQAQMDIRLVQMLGFDQISESARLAIKRGSTRGIPLIPSQLKSGGM